jgi:hypothetical protein
MVHKFNRQVKQEKVATKQNQIRIVELEKKIIALVINPKYPTIVGELVKKKDTRIEAPRKMLNLPKSQHVQTPELQDIHEEIEHIYHQLVERKKAITILYKDNERL